MTTANELETLFNASSLSVLLDTFDSQVKATEKSPRTTIAERKQALADALTTFDEDKLLELQEILSNFVDQLHSSEVAFDASGAELSETGKVQLMQRHQSMKKISELCDVVNDGLKRIVGEAVTAQVARQNPDEEFPEHVSGDIEVPSMGLRFCKEKAGRAAPHLDQKKLREQLGEDVWKEVTVTRSVPAHTVTELSEDLLLAKASTDPTILQKIKASLTPGGWKSWSFTVRKIKTK